MTDAEKYQHWLVFHSFQQSREKHFAPAIFRAVRSQYNTFLKSYKQGHRIDTALNHISSASIITVLKPLYMDAGRVYGAKVRAYLNTQKSRAPIGFNERMIALMQAYFNTDILNTSEGITDKTRELIQAVFSRSVELGLGIDDIIKQLENTELSRGRARLIARTETVTAANQGGMFAAKDTGLLLNKEWLATYDNRTRHDHARVNGQTVSMDQPFIVGGYEMQQPGDRGGKDGALKVPGREICNCRCTCLFQPIRDGQGRLLAA